MKQISLVMAATITPATNDAFELLISSDYYWKLTGESLQKKHNYRHLISSGKGVTIDKKEELLVKAGFTVVQEKTWNLPK